MRTSRRWRPRSTVPPAPAEPETRRRNRPEPPARASGAAEMRARLLHRNREDRLPFGVGDPAGDEAADPGSESRVVRPDDPGPEPHAPIVLGRGEDRSAAAQCEAPDLANVTLHELAERTQGADVPEPDDPVVARTYQD